MKRFFILISILLISTQLFGQYSAEYNARKAAMAPDRGKDAMYILAHNDYIAVQADTDGQFYIGTYPTGRTLTYNFPDPGGPWSSWTVISAEGALFTMDPFDGHGSSSLTALRVVDDFELVPHSGDSSYIQGTWTIYDVIDITQVLMPVYLVNPTDTTGSIFIHYTLVNTGEDCYQIGVLLQLDTMIGSNDAAPISTMYGYDNRENDFYGPDSMPSFWNAYEHPDGPAYTGDQLIALGILSGLDAVVPDRFAYGYWQRFWRVTWNYTIVPNVFTDSAVLLWWFPRTVCPGETLEVATYYGLGLEYREAGSEVSLVLPIEVTIDDPCDYTPDTFEANVRLGNTGMVTLNDAHAVITLPDGLVLQDTDSDTHSFSPSPITAGNLGSTSWSIIADGSVSDTTFHIHVDVYYMVAGTLVVKTVDGYISMDAIGFSAEAELINPLEGTRSTCVDQDIIMNITADSEIDPASIRFVVNGVEYSGSDDELTFDPPLLTFTPSSGFSDGEVITYALTNVSDYRGCSMNDSLSATFRMDFTGPHASNGLPPDGAVIGTTDIPEFSVNIEDAITEIDESTIELEVNGVEYDLSDPALTWDGRTLHFWPSVAGLEIIEGDSFEVCLLSASDMPPDYCEANPLEDSPYCWDFLVNIIDLSLPDTLGYIGYTIWIPVYIEEVDQYDMTSFRIVIEVNPDVLLPIGVETGGTITESWADSIIVTIDGGIIIISGSGSELSGDSILIYVGFVVNPEGPEGGFTLLEFGELTFNEGGLDYREEGGLYYTLWTTPEWLVNLTMTSPESEDPFYLSYGTSRFASDGFDFGLDLTALPSGQKIRAYFPLADRTFSYITKLQRDMRYYEDLPIIWDIDLDVEPDTAAWTIEWDPEEIPEGEMIIYIPGEMALDMHTNSSYSSIGDATIYIKYSQPDIRVQEITFYPGWNMVSFPFVPLVDVTFEDLLPGVFGNAYWYNPESHFYEEGLSPEAGKGYWLYAVDTVITRIAGMTVLEYAIPLYAGWHMVGVPYSPSGLVPYSGTFYDDSGPITSGNLEVGKGYWYLSLSPGILTATSSSVPARMLPYGSAPEFLMPIRYYTDDRTGEFNLGIDENASEGYDGYDEAIPPSRPEETRSVLLTETVNCVKINMAKNVKPPAKKISWEINTNEATELRWDTVDIPDGYGFQVLFNEKLYDMAEIDHLNVPASAKVIIEAERMLPGTVTLFGNYPNPFNAQTTISFSLPVKSDVELSVYNLLGETIRDIYSGELEVGTHRLTWDGKDEQTASLPSGVYYYRLKVGETEQVRKMLLVK
ncbi:T9SS type A sorting domain-containing protein [bacterium]|nr:T9SS type A sorting domain-containing protein [bacterium]